MTIAKKHWRNALDVQTACNLSGVVLAFADAIQAINEEARELGKGTDWRNTHPIAVLFSTQIGHLTKTCTLADTDVYHEAYEAVQEELRKKRLTLSYAVLNVFQRYWLGQGDYLYAVLSRRGNSVDLVEVEVSGSEQDRLEEVAKYIFQQSSEEGEVRTAESLLEELRSA